MSVGFGMYTRGLRLEYRASQIRQVPSSDDLQIFIFIFSSKNFIEKGKCADTQDVCSPILKKPTNVVSTDMITKDKNSTKSPIKKTKRIPLNHC